METHSDHIRPRHLDSPSLTAVVRDLAKAVHEADVKHDICPEHIERAVERHPTAKDTNRARGAHYVDCRWPAHNLTVELDSYRFHGTRRAWEKDRQRERDARARGDDFRR